MINGTDMSVRQRRVLHEQPIRGADEIWSALCVQENPILPLHLMLSDAISVREVTPLGLNPTNLAVAGRIHWTEEIHLGFSGALGGHTP